METAEKRRFWYPDPQRTAEEILRAAGVPVTAEEEAELILHIANALQTVAAAAVRAAVGENSFVNRLIAERGTVEENRKLKEIIDYARADGADIAKVLKQLTED